MRRTLLVITTSMLGFATLAMENSGQAYFPERGMWQTKPATELGFNQAGLDSAVNFAKNNEYSGSRDLRIVILKGFEREPFHEILGPTKKRGGPTGLIIKNGYIAPQWGDPSRVDMTFSHSDTLARA